VPAGHGREDRPRDGRAGTRFVIQQHDATTLHFDFRLEVDGALASWAVPKGLSLDPRHRRLAMRVDDHAIEYVGFEGVLADAPAGSGAVIVWDRGTYRSLSGAPEAPVPMADALAAGHAAFWLEGAKLVGGWALTRVAASPRERWIVVKMRDERADPARDVVRERPESVVSGRTIAELAAGAAGSG
jgi:DNA ligase D-like protein (predicted 3'-phosphoesterase)